MAKREAPEAIVIPPEFADYRKRLIVYRKQQTGDSLQKTFAPLLDTVFQLLEKYNPYPESLQFSVGALAVLVIYLRNPQHPMAEAITLIRMNLPGSDIQVEADVRMAPLQQAVNDRFYPGQWALKNMEAEAAWRRVAEVARIQPRPRVIVAIVDSGVMLNHEDLDQSNISGLRIIPPNNNDFSDDTGHGTMLAGTIAAVADNSIGIAGEAPNVTLLAYKITDTRTPPTALAAVAGILTALLNGAKVINASWHVIEDSGLLRQAILQAGCLGCVVVVAAGNHGCDNMEIPTLPASYGFNNMVVAMASDRHDGKSGFSNYGANVDLATPGERVLSTGLYYVNPAYRAYSGSSVSAAHASAAAALLLAIDDWTPAEIRAHLVASADPRHGLRGTCRADGRLNLKRAVCGPFSFTNPHAGDSLTGGSSFLVEWNSEYIAPVVNSVEIAFIDHVSGAILSSLGGLPNSGKKLVVVPNQPTAQAIVRIRCEQKYLYADSDKFQIA